MRSSTIEHVLEEDASSEATPDFGRLARVYRWMEWFNFGPFLWRCRCAFLGMLGKRRAALVLGDGDGRFTARLLRESAHITIDAVDASEAMLSEMRRRTGTSSSRVQTYLSDARGFRPARRDYD